MWCKLLYFLLIVNILHADGTKVKGKKGKSKKKKEKDTDDEAVEDSDDGDMEAKQVDYMSDTSNRLVQNIICLSYTSDTNLIFI